MKKNIFEINNYYNKFHILGKIQYYDFITAFLFLYEMNDRTFSFTANMPTIIQNVDYCISNCIISKRRM